MFSFQLTDAACGRSAQVITNAVQAIERGAKLRIDFAAHRGAVESNLVRHPRPWVMQRIDYKPEAFGNSALTLLPWSACRPHAVSVIR